MSRPFSCCYGCGKMICSVISCPIHCPIYCLAGTCFTIYHCVLCDIWQDEVILERDRICMKCGIETAMQRSRVLWRDGKKHIKRAVRVEQDMTR
jgi:hypothetical protein